MPRAISSGDKSTSMRNFFPLNPREFFFSCVPCSVPHPVLNYMQNMMLARLIRNMQTPSGMANGRFLYFNLFCAHLVPSVRLRAAHVYPIWWANYIYDRRSHAQLLAALLAYWLPCARYIILMVAKHLALYANEPQSHWTGGKEAIKSWKSFSYGRKKRQSTDCRKSEEVMQSNRVLLGKNHINPKHGPNGIRTHTESLHTECTCQL